MSVATAALQLDRPAVPDWFLDWSGQACAIVASGPSAKKANVSSLRGRLRVIAIKECAVDLAPWADVAYGCDAGWWMHRRGLPDFKGLKLAWASEVPTSYPDVRRVTIQEDATSRPHDKRYVNRILTDDPGVVGAGHNSGFQALNLAVQFGAIRILLIGFDMQGEHYYGRNNWYRGNNPDQHQFDRCIRAFDANAQALRSMGVDVVNASPDSALRCFREASASQALAGWNL